MSDIASLQETLGKKPKRKKDKKRDKANPKGKGTRKRSASEAPPTSEITGTPSSPSVAAEAGVGGAPSNAAAAKEHEGRQSRLSLVAKSLFSVMSRESDFSSSAVPDRPDFGAIAYERAVRYDYDARTMTWSHRPALVKIAQSPFAAGGMRQAHYMISGSPSELASSAGPTSSSAPASASQKLYVAKFILRPAAAMISNDEDLRKMCFQNCEQQMIARYYAELYNKYQPPKVVTFLEASLYELIDRPASPAEGRFCGVEEYITGLFCKWNNNFGFVHENTRNTPQAFSHFTFERSKHQILICDIQGVADIYTDPVIHTRDRAGSELFSGNLGTEGIEQFLLTHQCNPICKRLGLTPFGPAQQQQQQSQEAKKDSAGEGQPAVEGGTCFPSDTVKPVEITRTSVQVGRLGRVPPSEKVPLVEKADNGGCHCCTVL